tara:strand:+ start:695 stop:883 length:189 start_codon:yes stop_codon:yes gene_type:complete
MVFSGTIICCTFAVSRATSGQLVIAGFSLDSLLNYKDMKTMTGIAKDIRTVGGNSVGLGKLF